MWYFALQKYDVLDNLSTVISCKNFRDKNFRVKTFYVNDCSIRVVRSCIKIFVQEIYVQILHMKIILQRKKKANYGMSLFPSVHILAIIVMIVQGFMLNCFSF